MYGESKRELRLFERISEHTDRIDVHGGRVVVREYIETPYNEFGIVDKRELLQRILGSVANFRWEGSYEGPHHIMWPRNMYRGNQLTKQFRGSQSLKVIIPRNLHDYLHRITEPPELPSHDVMTQYHREQMAVNHLYELIRYHGLSDTDMTHEQKELYRQQRLYDTLGTSVRGEVGLMPDHDYLAGLPFTEARQVIRSIARIQGLSSILAPAIDVSR